MGVAWRGTAERRRLLASGCTALQGRSITRSGAVNKQRTVAVGCSECECVSATVRLALLVIAAARTSNTKGDTASQLVPQQRYSLLQNNLGVLYRSGTGVPIDYIAAVWTRS